MRKNFFTVINVLCVAIACVGLLPLVLLLSFGAPFGIILSVLLLSIAFLLFTTGKIAKAVYGVHSSSSALINSESGNLNYDVYAPLTIKEWKLMRDENGNVKCLFSFINLSSVSIKAINFLIYPLNLFGKPIKVGNNEYLSITLTVNSAQRDLQSPAFTLPADTYKVRITALGILYSDGSTFSNKSPDFSGDFEFSREEGAILAELKKINPAYVCIPKLYENGWLCACGRKNGSLATKCFSCASSREKVSNITLETISALVESREAARNLIFSHTCTNCGKPFKVKYYNAKDLRVDQLNISAKCTACGSVQKIAQSKAD
ncbi:MAG: hypothetical protein Q8873_01990 [Bacillota bacterium]|nr:hypothetical protein [Bacillota bacterium]